MTQMTHAEFLESIAKMRLCLREIQEIDKQTKSMPGSVGLPNSRELRAQLLDVFREMCRDRVRLIEQGLTKTRSLILSFDEYQWVMREIGFVEIFRIEGASRQFIGELPLLHPSHIQSFLLKHGGGRFAVVKHFRVEGTQVESVVAVPAATGDMETCSIDADSFLRTLHLGSATDVSVGAQCQPDGTDADVKSQKPARNQLTPGHTTASRNAGSGWLKVAPTPIVFSKGCQVISLLDRRIGNLISYSTDAARVDFGGKKCTLEISKIRRVSVEEKCALCGADTDGGWRYGYRADADAVLCFGCECQVNAAGARPRRDALNSAFSGGLYERNRRKH